MRLRIAFTIDDAPTVADAQVDASRMDGIRVCLQHLKLDHCVAFVVGREAQGNEDVLRRWLDCGYELGNHSLSSRKSERAFSAGIF
jgi:peptidoglycan/xylan/chitin deacetylase (PgdA/CDA1 family)